MHQEPLHLQPPRAPADTPGRGVEQSESVTKLLQEPQLRRPAEPLGGQAEDQVHSRDAVQPPVELQKAARAKKEEIR